jgi:hypothetical protein
MLCYVVYTDSAFLKPVRRNPGFASWYYVKSQNQSKPFLREACIKFHLQCLKGAMSIEDDLPC